MIRLYLIARSVQARTAGDFDFRDDSIENGESYHSDFGDGDHRVRCFFTFHTT